MLVGVVPILRVGVWLCQMPGGCVPLRWRGVGMLCVACGRSAGIGSARSIDGYFSLIFHDGRAVYPAALRVGGIFLLSVQRRR